MTVPSIDNAPPPVAPAHGGAGVSHPALARGASGAQPHTPSAAEVDRAMGSANAILQQQARAVEFEYDRTSRTTVIRLVDLESGQVLRQFPSREMLAIAQALERMQGALVSREA